jgi:hypothetical protein
MGKKKKTDSLLDIQLDSKLEKSLFDEKEKPPEFDFKPVIKDKDIESKIIRLHDEVIRYGKMTIDRAIEIGQLLCKKKEKLEHGKWSNWVNIKMPFTIKTCQRYMDCFTYQGIGQLKSDRGSNLTEYRKLIALEKEKERKEKVEQKKKDNPELYKEPEIITAIEEQEYLLSLQEVIRILPKSPPVKWNNNQFSDAIGLVDIIIKRLEAFKEIKN